MKKRKLLNLFVLIVNFTLIFAFFFNNANTYLFAEESENTVNYDDNTNNYNRLLSKKDYLVSPGVKESLIVLDNADESNRNVVHVMEIDPKNEYVSILPSYKNQDPATASNWGTQTTSQLANYVVGQGKNVVGAMNTCLSWSTDEPLGKLVIDGTVYRGDDNYVSCDTYLAVKTSGEASLRNITAPLESDDNQVISASFGFIVKDGVNLYASQERTSKAPRSVLGIKYDGSIIMMMNDGRQMPFSNGMSYNELAELMISLGCKDAVNCDGGGSSTFLSKRAGTDSLIMRSSPSDGSERPTTCALLVVSTAPKQGEFSQASLSTEYDYYTPYSSVNIDAIGSDVYGNPSSIPSNVEWEVEDSKFGTVKDGKFTSTGATGLVSVNLKYNSKTVGKVSFNIVNPDSISYSNTTITIPYGKTVDLKIKATYNGNTVFYKESDFDIAVQSSAGQVSNFKFTATTDESITEAQITTTYKHSTLDPIVLGVSFGKGSEVIFDFEDGNIEDFTGDIDKIKELTGSDPTSASDTKWKGNYVEGTTVTTFAATKENGGKVKDGNYSLGIRVDHSTNFSLGTGWLYWYLYYTGETKVLRDVENGLNTMYLGMWINIPKEALGIYGGPFVSSHEDANSEAAIKGDYFDFTGNDDDGFNNMAEEDLTEDGWYYVKVPLTVYGGNYTTTVDSDASFFPTAFVRFFANGLSIPQNYYIYIDDITLDFSEAVDDREAPIISDMKIDTTDGDNSSEIASQTIDSNTVSLTATIADDQTLDNYSGLNYDTAKIYVDGNDLSTNELFTLTDTKMSICGLVLQNGYHEVTFEISDNMGNTTTITKNFTIAGTLEYSSVTLEGHNDSGKTPVCGSVYYLDVKATNIENIDNVTMTIKVRTDCRIEPLYSTVLDGFDYSFVENKTEGSVSIVLTNNSTATGNNILLSIPVRVWYLGKPIENMNPIVDIIYQSTKGLVTYKDYSNIPTNFIGGIGNKKVTVKTELYAKQNIILTDNPDFQAYIYGTNTEVLNLAPTCTKAGYQNRIYDLDCMSVIDWGTTIEATGHTYSFIDGLLKCSVCGELYNGIYTDNKLYSNGLVVNNQWINDSYYVDGIKVTGINVIDGLYYNFDENGVNQGKLNGLFTLDSNNYYAIDGNLQSGWVEIDTLWYYFDESYIGVTGSKEININGVIITYEFTNGKLNSGVWNQDADGTRYYFGPSYYHAGQYKWVEIDGATYCFNSKGYRLVGNNIFAEAVGAKVLAYEFDLDGKLVKQITGTQFFTTEAGTHYLHEGVAKYDGLIEIDGSYYYINGRYVIVTGTYYVTKNNGLMASGYYNFDETGKMIITNYEGIVDIDGTLYYYENNKLFYKGLMEIDGSYYYVNSKGIVVTGTYYVTKNNGLMASDYYNFDETGKMIITNYEGIVDIDGILYYYENNELVYKGLMEIDGSYYYVNSKGIVVTGTYYVTKNNGLMASNYYNFDETGKMIITNYEGIVDIEGILYYYENNELVYKGLMEIDGSYYYVNSKGIVVTGTYYVTKNNEIMASDYYNFDETGKMIIVEETNYEGIVDIEGTLYYYENNKLVYKGLVEIAGSYYYVNGKGIVVIGTYYVTKNNGLMDSGYYTFDETGKMIIVEETNYEGIVDIEGTLYYYENNKLVYKGLMEIAGSYYYVNGKGIVVTGTYYVTKNNGLMDSDYYTFDETGKMIIVEETNYEGIVDIEGTLYYYENNKLVYKGLMEIAGSYYYVNSKGIVVTGTYFVTKNNEIMASDYYNFDETGKMIIVEETNYEGIVDIEGTLYYYENNKLVYKGLVEMEGSYYYVNGKGIVVTGTYYVTKNNGLMDSGYYTFDETGKMIL